MFRLAPMHPVCSKSVPSVYGDQLTKSEIVNGIDIWTQEAVASAGAQSSSSSNHEHSLIRTDPIVKELMFTLDAFFHHRLKKADKRYWPAVKEFLSRRQVADLIACWGPKSVRGYSLAWLLHSLNEETLEYQLLGFRQGRAILRHYYEPSAYMLDPELIDTVARFIGRLATGNVRLDLRPPNQPISIDVYRSLASAPNDNSLVPVAQPATDYFVRHQPTPKKSPTNRTEKSRPQVNGIYRNETPASIDFSTLNLSSDRYSDSGRFVANGDRNSSRRLILDATTSNDYIFDEIIQQNSPGRGKNILFDDADIYVNHQEHPMPQNTTDNHFFGTSQPIEEQPPPTTTVDYFDEALRKQLSSVKIDQLANVSTDPIEFADTDIIPSNWLPTDRHETSRMKSVDNIPDGEMILDDAEIISLGMQVFRKENGEQFYKMFIVYEHHTRGTPTTRWLLLTNFAVYVLIRRDPSHTDGQTADVLSFHSASYEVVFMTPLQLIDSISIGNNGQQLTILASIDEQQHPSRRCIELCTGSEQLTSSILSNIDRSVSPTKLVCIADTNKMISIKKWASGELRKQPNDIRIQLYSLVYWRSCAMTDRRLVVSQIGYLYYRSMATSGWTMRNGDDWQYGYFVLNGQKLYQFNDSSCKCGVRVINIRGEIESCSDIPSMTERMNVFEIRFAARANASIQFAAPTKQVANQWIRALLLSMSIPDAIDSHQLDACIALIMTTHLLLGQDGANEFFRTLAMVPLNEVHCVVVIRTDNHSALVVCTNVAKSNDQQQQRHWLLYRTAAELDKAIGCLRNLNVAVFESNDDACSGSGLIDSTECTHLCEQCMNLPDIWHTIHP